MRAATSSWRTKAEGKVGRDVGVVPGVEAINDLPETLVAGEVQSGSGANAPERVDADGAAADLAEEAAIQRVGGDEPLLEGGAAVRLLEGLVLEDAVVGVEQCIELLLGVVLGATREDLSDLGAGEIPGGAEATSTEAVLARSGLGVKDVVEDVIRDAVLVLVLGPEGAEIRDGSDAEGLHLLEHGVGEDHVASKQTGEGFGERRAVVDNELAGAVVAARHGSKSQRAERGGRARLGAASLNRNGKLASRDETNKTRRGRDGDWVRLSRTDDDRHKTREIGRNR